MTMKVIFRHQLILTIFGLATISSLLRNLSSTRRIISSSEEEYLKPGGSSITDSPFIDSSKLHYMLDEKLETRYSTTHKRIRGRFSLILNDNEETNTGNDDFQHKGILKTSTEKHGKWMKIRFNIPPDAEFTVAGETIHKAGTNYSKFVDDMRLVIDTNHSIILNAKERFSNMKDQKGDESHLCYLLRIMTGRRSLDVVPKKGVPPVVLNVTADCSVLNEELNGQGNTILALLGIRMTTALAKVDFTFQCRNNGLKGYNPSDYKKEKARKLRWVFPWFASHQSATNEKDPWPHMGEAPTQDQLCYSSKRDSNSSFASMPLEKMADQIRYDVRKMAVQLIGSQTNDLRRIHPLIPLDAEPWIPDISPDDVIIHLPCYCDINDWKEATTKQLRRVGIMQFREYTKYIDKSVRSIGIIRETSEKQRRDSNEDLCHRASTLLFKYLESWYRNQPVTISIYDNDTPPLQFARMAMAKQSFSSFSTFGMIPIIGTFGEGYFQTSDPDSSSGSILGYDERRTNIIRNIISGGFEGFGNLNMMNANVLSPEKMDTMTFDDISKWLLKPTS